MNEKRNIEPALDPDSPETRTRSDVAPKRKLESGAPARHISGLRPAVHLPKTPSVPPPPLTPEDLLEDGWDDAENEDDDEDSGPTLLDTHGSLPPDVIARARALHDPIGEREQETHEVSTRELSTRTFSAAQAPTFEMPTVQNAPTPRPSPAPTPFVTPLEIAALTDAADTEQEEEFGHDDFPTRQTPRGLQQALLAYPLPTDSHRGLHETLVPSAEDNDSTPDLPSSPSLGPTVAAPVAPLSPLRARIALPAPSPMPMPMHVSPLAASAMPLGPDETAQMANRPHFPRLDDLSPLPPPAEPSSVSQVSHASYHSHVSQPSQPMPLAYPTPTSMSGAPLPPANAVRFAFLKNLSPHDDPPINRLLFVGALSFFATLVLSAFIAWIMVLLHH